MKAVSQMFGSKDGPSLRKIMGFIMFVWGGVLMTLGQFQSPEYQLLDRITPGGVLVIAGLFLLGFVTAQNLKEIKEAVK